MRRISTMILGSLVAASGMAGASIITIDADTYAPGTNVSNAIPGVTLSEWTAGGGALTSDSQLPSTFKFSPVSVSAVDCGACDTAFTGQNAFGLFTGVAPLSIYTQLAPTDPNSSEALEGWDLFNASFSSPTNFVQVIAGGFGPGDTPALLALDSAGAPVARCNDNKVISPQNCIALNITNSIPGAGDAWEFLVQDPGNNISTVDVGGFDGGAYVQSLTFNRTVDVPEPGTLPLFALGFVGLGFTMWRKSTVQANRTAA